MVSSILITWNLETCIIARVLTIRAWLEPDHQVHSNLFCYLSSRSSFLPFARPLNNSSQGPLTHFRIKEMASSMVSFASSLLYLAHLAHSCQNNGSGSKSSELKLPAGRNRTVVTSGSLLEQGYLGVLETPAPAGGLGRVEGCSPWILRRGLVGCLETLGPGCLGSNPRLSTY